MALSANDRFEVIGLLYYGDTGFLRPGKSEPLATNRSANSDENRERFDQWFATRAFNSAIERIAVLQEKLEKLEDAEVFAESAWGPTAEQLKEIK